MSTPTPAPTPASTPTPADVAALTARTRAWVAPTITPAAPLTPHHKSGRPAQTSPYDPPAPKRGEQP